MSSGNLLSVDEARARILADVAPLAPESVPLEKALGRVLAAPIHARHDLPPFANSAMDGYAVVAADTADDLPVTLKVVGDVAAGAPLALAIATGAAARIMTGAPLPAGADAVVPVEDTNEAWRGADRPLPAAIEIRRAVRAGDYVRHAGEDVRTGEAVLAAGRVLRPQEIGLLAALGVASLPVVGRPRVAILSTGDELVEVVDVLKPGQIRNSNSYALAAQVEAVGSTPLRIDSAADRLESVRSRLDEAIEAGAHILVSSAGVSVGAFDAVRMLLEQEGTIQFWRVNMRPGKPLLYASYRDLPYLGLPGNPVSAQVTFELFARPAILRMLGHADLARPRVRASMVDGIASDGRESYIRAVVTRNGDNYEARTTGGQGSHLMTSLVRANALLLVPAGVRQVDAGDELDALMLDWPTGVF